MGKGRPKSMKRKGMKGGKGRGGILSQLTGGAQQLAGGGFGTPGGIMTGGLYRVNSRTGEIVKISKPRRRRGYRMPGALREQLRANTLLTQAIAMKVAGGS